MKNLYADIIKDVPKQGRKWRVVLKHRGSDSIIMKGLTLYRYKRDAISMRQELET